MDVFALNAPCRSFPEMIPPSRISESMTPSQPTAQPGGKLFVKISLVTTRPNMEAHLWGGSCDISPWRRALIQHDAYPERLHIGTFPDRSTVSKVPPLRCQIIDTGADRIGQGAQGCDGAPLSARLDLGHRNAVHARFFGKGSLCQPAQVPIPKYCQSYLADRC